MPDERLPHLWIPAERARIERLEVRGGGDTFSRADLAEHSRELLAAFRRSIERFEGKEDLDLATELIVQITMAAARPVSKERQHLRNLGFEVLALSADAPNVAIASIKRENLGGFQKRLERYAGSATHIGKSNFAAIEAITPVAASRKLDSVLAQAAATVPISCLITVYGSLPENIKDGVAERIAGTLREQAVSQVQIHRFANGVVAVAGNLTRSQMELVSEQFMFVRSIESNGEFVAESAIETDPVPNIIQVDSPRCGTPVVVVDSGISGACALLAGLVLRTVNELPPGCAGPHLTHGTFVASRVVYGDDITSVLNRRAAPWCPVIDVQVTGDDGIGNRIPQSGAQLGEILQRVVPQLAGEAKVFNLSLGLTPISDGAYSTVARLIDFLSREHQVLFVIAAGNIDAPNSVPPSHYVSDNSRILSPSESLLALSVGAKTGSWEPNCVVAQGALAPFSRRGPGADGALKPEVAANGGNACFNGIGAPWGTSPRVGAYGLSRNGMRFAYTIGTSSSAPLVSQYAARLFDAYSTATPNLVRALLCHFAETISTPGPLGALQPHHFCGFGEPNIDRALFSTGAAASYLHQGTIEKDTYLYIPFHVPQAMVNTASSKLVIRGTVVFDPPVSLDDSVNYSLCRIAGKLRKRTADGHREVNIGGDEDDVLYPWNPTLHFAHSFRRGYAAGEWELRLRLMTRGELPDNFVQSLSAIIEVVDDNGTVDVRTSIVTEFPGVYVPVQLRMAA